MSSKAALDFEVWLAYMPEALEEFLLSLPVAVAQSLDFSPASLAILEAWLLEEFADVQVYKNSDIAIFDGVPRYVGEVIRRAVGGNWDIDLQNKKNVYYGTPVVVAKGRTPVCPHKLATAALSRRSGDLFSGVAE